MQSERAEEWRKLAKKLQDVAQQKPKPSWVGRFAGIGWIGLLLLAALHPLVGPGGWRCQRWWCCSNNWA